MYYFVYAFSYKNGIGYGSCVFDIEGKLHLQFQMKYENICMSMIKKFLLKKHLIWLMKLVNGQGVNNYDMP